MSSVTPSEAKGETIGDSWHNDIPGGDITESQSLEQPWKQWVDEKTLNVDYSLVDDNAPVTCGKNAQAVTNSG